MRQRKPLRARVIRKRGLREKVYERDQGICVRCQIYDAKWEADHKLALWCGGKDDIDNMQTLCRRCHLAKSVGDTPIRAKTDRLAARHTLTQVRKAIR